jgi:hypothetical protein
MEYMYTEKDGSTTKYTEEMLKNVIADKIYYQNNYFAKVSDVADTRTKVYRFFKDAYTPGESEIVCSVDDVNELLESIGADRLKSLYTVNGSIAFCITDVEAESEDEANELVADELQLDYRGNGSVDSWDVEISDVSEQ